MGILNAVAAITGLIGLIGLVTTPPYPGGLDEYREAWVRAVAIIQLASGLAGMFAAGRAWRHDLSGGALIVGGAALFAIGGYITAFSSRSPDLGWLMFLGGVFMALGWLALAISGSAPSEKPARRDRRD